MTASLSAPTQRAAWLEQWLSQLPAASGALAAVQQRGRAALAQQGVPSSRSEDWRFTDLSLLQALPLAAAQPAQPTLDAGGSVLRLQLDGQSDPLAGVTLPAGLEVLSEAELAQGLGHTLAATACQQHWPVELKQASATQVLALRVKSRASAALELVSASSGGMLPLRILLVLEEKAQLDLSQLIEARAAGLVSLVIEAHLARSAQLRHGLVAFGQNDAALFSHIAVEQEPESHAALSNVVPARSAIGGRSADR